MGEFSSILNGYFSVKPGGTSDINKALNLPNLKPSPMTHYYFQLHKVKIIFSNTAHLLTELFQENFAIR